MFRIALIIGLGGFLGTIARYFSMLWVTRSFQMSFPLGTFIVNVIGCFLIGLFWGISEKGNFLSNELRLFLTVGICGGFTTFSTFTADGLALLRNGETMQFFMYTILSVVIGLLFTLAGFGVTRIGS